MGFEQRETHYKLTFGDTELEGLEVVAKSVSSGELLDLMDIAGKVDTSNKKFMPDDLKAVRGLLEGFANALVSWNLEKDGRPVEATLDNVRKQEFTFIMPIVTAWMDAIAGVNADLGKDSDSGNPSLEALIPMVTS